MAIKPMPTPSADPYSAYNTEKNKKKKQTNNGYVTNTVTPPPQPAPEVNRTANSSHSTGGVSAPKQTQIYEQPVPKPDTSSHTNGYLANAGSYNPLSLKQNSQSSQKSAMDTIYNKTVTYDAVPTPKTQHGSIKPQQPKSYSYTEPKAKANQYVNNGVNTNNTAKTYSYNSPKTYTYNQPKTYTYTSPKTNIGEYKTLGGYTNTNPYVTKDRVGNGQNSYSAQPKPQVKNDYTGAKKPTVVDELWNRYYTEVAGTNGIKQPQKLTKTTKPKQQNTNTVKAGKSTINIRDDGSTIHYDSDTAIDLFDFLDFLSGRYGPSNEMAESVKIAKEISEIPDLIAKAQPKNNLENSVLQYEDMIRKPDALYGINADEWIENAPENWEETYKDKWFKKKIFGNVYENRIIPYIDGLKTAEKEILLENPVKSAYLFLNRDKLTGAKNMATALRNKVYVYNENEPDAVKPYTVEEANIDGSIPNALLHTTWSAFLTYDFGEEFAREITTAHETLDKEQYADDKIYSQPEIYTDMANGVYNPETAYPTLQQHMEMDLHNNALGISIAKEIKQMTDDEVREELEYYYQSGDDEEYFDKMYPELEDDRKRLMFIVCLKAVQYGDAAIIWDKYGVQIDN